MRHYVIAIISVFLQSVVGIFHLPVLVVIAEPSYVLAFVTGLLADFVLGNQLGVLAASYLLVALIVNVFKSRFQFNWRWAMAFSIVSQIIFFYARGFIS